MAMADVPASLQATNRRFYLDSKEIVLLSGAMHYFRVVPEYWRDRLLRMKACGLNAVETYVPWNLHEEIRGEFNFDGMLDVRTYIKTAQEVGLYVLFRPGPYICSEWDFGGLPSWLLHDPDMKVRSAYTPYLEAVDRYLGKLLTHIADLQYNKGGPIIAVQLENEYGSYGDNMDYKLFLKETFTKYGITELLFTSDNGMGIQRAQIPGALMTVNFQERDHGLMMFEYLRQVKQRDKPLMVMEFWSGWFDHWGKSSKHEVWPAEKFAGVLKWILKQKSSVNFYMMHGGTNFGFMNGANEDLGATNDAANQPYSPDCTSYDYDAPIAENGDLTPKFYIIKELLAEFAKPYVPDNIPEPPESIPSKAYGKVEVCDHLLLENLLSHITPIESDKPVAMEMLNINNGGGQSFGFTLYRKLNLGQGQKLTFNGKVKDRAVVILNGDEIDTVDWLSKSHVTTLPERSSANGSTLDIFVENLGRVNYADFGSGLMNDQRKGLRDDVSLDSTAIRDWLIYPMDFKKDFIEGVSASDEHWGEGPGSGGCPTLNRLKLVIKEKPTDTFVHMKGWTKGVVFVNGFNLGRYWDIGPQQTLYLPGPLLREGENEILVFELHKPSNSVTFVDKPELGEITIHKQVLPTPTKMKLAMLKALVSMGKVSRPLLRLVMK